MNLSINPTSWGAMKTLMQHPKLLEHGAWFPSEVKFKYIEDKAFEYNNGDKAAYEQYCEEKAFDDDFTKFMLDTVPDSLSENNDLSLPISEVKYSQIRYKLDILLRDESFRQKMVDRVLTSNKIEFAHVISLFVLIISSDDDILLARRSLRAGYHPGTWQASLSEQIEFADLFTSYQTPSTDEIVIEMDKPKPIDVVMQDYIQRAVKEELNIKLSENSQAHTRILSLFFESDVLNIGICAYVELDIASSEILNIAKNHAKHHHELLSFEMLPFSAIGDELVNPSYGYHPASQYMLYMYLLHRDGHNALRSINKRLNGI